MALFSRTARLELLKLHVEDTAVNLSDEDWNSLAHDTDGYSGSDIRSVVIGALYEPVKRMKTANHWKENFGQ